MQGDKDVIEYLNKSLKHEMTAVNQYWLHYRLLEDWGYTKLAKKLREESIEEMGHADKLIERILMLEGHPNMQYLDPLRIGEDIKECLECDLAGEYSARNLYQEAHEVCEEKKDYVTQKLFEELLADEEGHIDWLETQLELLENIGIQNYGLLQAGSAEDSE
ncbi:MAG: bacterioferritin [Rhodomicrobium sp.]|nr:MAG: bacterioferritin [Rhodomicrobium sp.]